MLCAFWLTGGLLTLSLAHCGARQTAIDEYKAQLGACVDTQPDPPSRISCIHDVQSRWDDAGAKPAAGDQ